MMKNRENILNYKLANPDASVARIAKDLGISSTSPVQHHLVSLRIDGLLPKPLPRSKKAAIKYRSHLIEIIEKLDKIIND